MSASIEQIWNILASRPRSGFTPTFIFCSPICANNCGVVFVWKYILVFEKWFFSFDRSNMHIFTMNITRVVWPHVTNILNLRYFCQHNPFFYLLNLILCHFWSWQRNIWYLIVVSVAAKQLKAGCCYNAIVIYRSQTGEQSVMLWKKKMEWVFSRTSSYWLPHDTRVKFTRNESFLNEFIWVFIPV